jgi:hypothetical protein
MGLLDNVQSAKREKIFTKIALMAPSGGGKSYGSLRLASGMLSRLKELGQEGNGRILVLNTESTRGRYYANEFQYDIYDVMAPHEPEKYVQLIEEAVNAGYPIVIMDSTSHEWEGKGGCLELHNRFGGTYQAWAKVTPRHDKFLMAIADSPIHIIATMRGKDQYIMETQENSKTSVKKIGVGAKQRDGFEYEFTVTFTVDQKSNMSTVQKDNTHLFENEGEVKLSEEHGRRIIDWANSGEGYTPPVRESKSVDQIIKEAQSRAVELCSELGGKDNKEMMALLETFTTSFNPNKIKDLNQLNDLIGQLENMKENKGE